MDDQAESSRRAPPMTPPPPPPSSPTILEDRSSDAILWAAPDDCSSSTSHTDLLSLWLSNYTALPQPEVEEEPLADVPTLLNFDLESSFRASFPDLVDWNTTSAVVMQAPAVTQPQPLWVQLQAAGEVDDLSRLALGIQSPKASILPLALKTQYPEAFVSPLALGIEPPPASFEIQSPEASFSPLALGLQSPPASFGIQPPQAPISPLARGIQFPQASISPPISPLALGLQSPPASFGIQPPHAPISPLALGIESSISPLARGIQFPQASISPPISPLALGIQSPQISFGIQSAPASFSSLPSIPCTLPMAPPLWNLPSIPCTLPTAPPLWNLPSVPCTLPMAPPLWNFLPSSSPVPERLSWSVFPSTPPPAPQQSIGASSPSSHPSHQTHQFFPAANTGYQQQGSVAHAPVTFSTPNANANFSPGFVPASRPSWPQAMVPRGSWTPNQPWISSGQDMKLPIPRRPRFSLPSAAAATMPAPPPLLANFGSSVGIMSSWNARGDVPVGDHQRVQTGESSRPRKRSKLALDPCGSEAIHWSHNGAKVAPIVREKLTSEPALNTNGKMRALPGTATDSQSLFARYRREKIKHRMKILQRLVPNGDKAEMAILLEQAYTYIKFLEQQVKLLKSNVDWKLATPFVYNNMDLTHPQR